MFNKKVTIIAISSCHYQRLGLCHYFTALKLFFEYFVIIYTCLRIFFFFFLLIIFAVIDMLLPLYVLCSKIAIKKNLVYSQVSRDRERFPVFTVGTLVENLLVCGVQSLSHRTRGAKRLNLGFFCPRVWSLTFLKIL